MEDTHTRLDANRGYGDDIDERQPSPRERYFFNRFVIILGMLVALAFYALSQVH